MTLIMGSLFINANLIIGDQKTMSIKVEQFPDKNIVLTYVAPLSVPADAITALQESSKFKQEMGGTCYRILDFTQANLNFSDMVVGMAFEKGHDGGVYDANVPNIFIGSGELVKLGVESLATQEHYQGANVKGLYASREEALACVEKLRENK